MVTVQGRRGVGWLLVLGTMGGWAIGFQGSGGDPEGGERGAGSISGFKRSMRGILSQHV